MKRIKRISSFLLVVAVLCTLTVSTMAGNMFYNRGTFNNHATFTNNGAFDNAGTVNNYGNIANSGKFRGNGTFKALSGSKLNTLGSGTFSQGRIEAASTGTIVGETGVAVAAAYQEAVDVVKALGIMADLENGFGPTLTMTRSQGAMLVALMMLGNSASSVLPGTGTKFDDVPADHWAAGYIEYLATSNIVFAESGNNFNPDASLTTSELARMLLGVLGYDAEKEKLNGDNWESMAMSLAGEEGLFNGNSSARSSESVTRQEAALYIFNALNAPMVEYQNQGTEPDMSTAIRTYLTSFTLSAQTISQRKIDNTNPASGFLVELAEERYKSLLLTNNADSTHTWTYNGTKIGIYAGVIDAGIGSNGYNITFLNSGSQQFRLDAPSDATVEKFCVQFINSTDSTKSIEFLGIAAGDGHVINFELGTYQKANIYTVSSNTSGQQEHGDLLAIIDIDLKIEEDIGISFPSAGTDLSVCRSLGTTGTDNHDTYFVYGSAVDFTNYTYLAKVETGDITYYLGVYSLFDGSLGEIYSSSDLSSMQLCAQKGNLTGNSFVVKRSQPYSFTSISTPDKGSQNGYSIRFGLDDSRRMTIELVNSTTTDTGSYTVYLSGTIVQSVSIHANTAADVRTILSRNDCSFDTAFVKDDASQKIVAAFSLSNRLSVRQSTDAFPVSSGNSVTVKENGNNIYTVGGLTESNYYYAIVGQETYGSLLYHLVENGSSSYVSATFLEGDSPAALIAFYGASESGAYQLIWTRELTISP